MTVSLSMGTIGTTAAVTAIGTAAIYGAIVAGEYIGSNVWKYESKRTAIRKKYNGRKAAEEAAKRASKGNTPRHDPNGHPDDPRPHWHPNNPKKPGITHDHYYYPWGK